MTERIRPKGLEIVVTDTDQVVLKLDNPGVPEIVFDSMGAKQVGSVLAGQGDVAEKPDGGER